jgi:hypothetical protein
MDSNEVSTNPSCVAWEYRTHYGSDTSTPGWGPWERVEARSALCTVDDRVMEIQQYIDKGYKYELRALYTCSELQEKDLIAILNSKQSFLNEQLIRGTYE